MSSELSLEGATPWNLAFLPPQDLAPHAPATSEENVLIAPWLAPDYPPTPPSKDKQRSFGFPSKSSFSSLHLKTSTSNLSTSVRGSTDASSSTTDFVLSPNSDTRGRDTHPTLRKHKSAMKIMNIIRQRSRPRASTDEPLYPQQSLAVPPIPSPSTYQSLPIILPSSRKEKSRSKRSQGEPPPVPPKEPEFRLDTNLDEMDGIVDLTVLPELQTGGLAPEASSPGSGFESSNQSSFSASDGSFHLVPSSPSRSRANGSAATAGMFSNPFLPSNRRKAVPPHLNFDRKISPKTQPPAGIPGTGTPVRDDGALHSPTWIAPESWAVERDGEGEAVEEPDSTSDESVGAGRVGRPLVSPRKPTKRRTRYSKHGARNVANYKIRIYRANNTYHVVSCTLAVTVAELTPVLNRKLLLDPDREAHRLYLKERGRERVLASTERPADIVRRRLEQAGYDVADGLDLLGADDIGFLLKFVYKSNLLGPAEEELTFESSEYIDLTGRSLKTIPIVLYSHAEAIVSLNLSRNPLLEIPLDFIQSCVTLRELRLSNMAMKKVPQSVRHSSTLNRLDLSCNRIVDLDDAGLDRIPELSHLKAQNNRMETLPWYFPRLRALKVLNISNNKFTSVPSVIGEMASLIDLDISFNTISELPEGIGRLHLLDRLIIVGNRVSKFPEEIHKLVHLRVLDCRRNNITDLSTVCTLPKLEILRADHNAAHALDLSLGPCFQTVDVSYNDITQLSLAPGPVGHAPYSLTSLDISHAKLTSLDDLALGRLTSLMTLRLDCNAFRFIPDSLGDLTRLRYFSCSENQLAALPASIGRLQKLETLDVHNNCLQEMPLSLWSCASLQQLNVTSNLLSVWHDPPSSSLVCPLPMSDTSSLRKTSASSMLTSGSSVTLVGSTRPLPPLAFSLERLYLGENKLTEDVLLPLTVLRELRVLNLSFNDIQEIPSTFFRNLINLEELYLSGNKLSSLPTEDLPRLIKLTVLFLNGNKLQTLPQELGKIISLAILDVGSNVLKYNINNWEFDWNWNFNQNLRYLNLSGNKRLEIKPDHSHRTGTARQQQQRKVLTDFSGLTQLRVLGLMDVTTTFVTNIPDESEDRRVRTSPSEVNRMAYGIADSLGKGDQLSMFDLVKPEFRDQKEECVFAMFGRSQSSPGHSRLPKYLQENFLGTFSDALDALDPNKHEGVPDALRRSFLKLNKIMYDFLFTSANTSRKMSQASTSTATTPINDMSILRSGASGIVLYFQNKTMYVANAGDSLAVISRQGSAKLVSRKHDPFDRSETGRIRAAEGWVNPKGWVNEEIDISRSFGFYHLLPAVNPRPDISTWALSELDEFVIIANRGLWDYVSYQTAVDIVRPEKGDPMIAAQKLRDFAISYGADGCTMIMVICVADLFRARLRQDTLDSLLDSDAYLNLLKKKRNNEVTIRDPNISRLGDEVRPPVGHIALVFTDIRNSTHLYEANAGMAAAMRMHNFLLRRQLRLCGGYEVKTEGDAFMCSFPTVLSAIWWCLSVQVLLLHEPWPLEILECEDGKEVYDSRGTLLARGLSVRMGIHCGTPVCEPDPVTDRMDYFGPVVIRASRISGHAAGGQLLCSADVIREIKARVFETGPDTEYSDMQIQGAIDAIRELGATIIPVGEVKLKGLEIPESLSLVYPTELAGRQELKESTAGRDASEGSKVHYSIEQMRELALLCVRLETLTSSRVFRPTSQGQEAVPPLPMVMYGDPSLFIPTIRDKASDHELVLLLDSLSVRIDNALVSLTIQHISRIGGTDGVFGALRDDGCDERTLKQLASLFGRR